jgi:hypothetical protein
VCAAGDTATGHAPILISASHLARRHSQRRCRFRFSSQVRPNRLQPGLVTTGAVGVSQIPEDCRGAELCSPGFHGSGCALARERAHDYTAPQPWTTHRPAYPQSEVLMGRIRFVRLLSASFLAWTLCASLALAQSQPPADPDAVFNVQSKIYHRPSCTSARRCTKNCIVIKLSEAKKRGGRACQTCGGPSASPTNSSDSQMCLTAADSISEPRPSSQTRGESHSAQCLANHFAPAPLAHD